MVLEHHGWRGKIVPVFEFSRQDVFLACNPGVPDAVIGRLNDAFVALGRDGTLKRIERNYDRWTPNADK